MFWRQAGSASPTMPSTLAGLHGRLLRERATGVKGRSWLGVGVAQLLVTEPGDHAFGREFAAAGRHVALGDEDLRGAGAVEAAQRGGDIPGLTDLAAGERRVELVGRIGGVAGLGDPDRELRPAVICGKCPPCAQLRGGLLSTPRMCTLSIPSSRQARCPAARSMASSQLAPPRQPFASSRRW